MKKKLLIIFCIILVVIIALGLYMKKPRTLAELMGKKVEVGYDYETIYKSRFNGEYDLRSVKIKESEGIDEIWTLLNKTKISFKKVSLPPDLVDGEVWYEITDMQRIKSIQITNSGEVYTTAFHIPQLNVVYSVSDKELNEFFIRMEELREFYGEK